MRTFRLFLVLALAVVALALLAPLTTLGQTFSATTGTDPVITTTPEPGVTRITVAHPRNGDGALLYVRVRDGVYTVDGMVAKVRLNYEVEGVRFMYLFVPGVGTAVLSTVADHSTVTTEAKLQDNDLTFAVGDHRYKLTGIALASDKGPRPEHLFVKLDRNAWGLNRQPMIGFGNKVEAPYEWPGALTPATTAAAQTADTLVQAPPVPASLLPSSKPLRPAAPASLTPVSLQPADLH